MALLVLCGCTPTHLESGRYACEPGLPDQCPGAWRCGLEGYCHQLGNTTVAWRCETSADCEGGFSCGLSKSGEFRECHDPSAPRAYDCLTDEDCVGGWRCGPEEVCLDPSTDALGDLVLAAVGSGRQINSLGSRSPVSQFSVSPFFTEGRARGRGNLAFVQDGHVRAMSVEAAAGLTATYDLGTDLPVALIAHGARGTISGGVPDERERVSMLWPDGGLTTFRFESGGSITRDDNVGNPVPPFDMFGQGSGGPGLTPVVYAVAARPGNFFGRIEGEFVDWFNLWTEEFDDFATVPNNRIRSITGLRFRDWLECVYMVDERGLWASQKGFTTPTNEIIKSWNFEPVDLDQFKHSNCPASQGPKITSAIGLSDRWLGITAQVPGGRVQVSLLDAARSWLSPGPVGAETFCASEFNRPCDADDRLPMDVAWGPCPACPADTQFRSMALVEGPPNGTPFLEVTCAQPNVPAAVFRLSAGPTASQCQRELITGPSSYFSASSTQPARPVPGAVGWSGSSGELWFGADSHSLASVTFDRAPDGVVRSGPGGDDYFVFTEELIGRPLAGLGLSSNHAGQYSAPVAHAPTVVVSGTQLVDITGGAAASSNRTIGYVSALALGAPVSAALTKTQAETLAVLAAGTTLYAGEVSQALANTGPAAALLPKLSTLEPIKALAFPAQQPAGSGPLVSGYAVAGSSVLRVVADTLLRWRTEAVVLPSTLLPLAVWFQGEKARVGFHDGSVFSLPSRVRISQPLPGGDAVDFAQACGQQLALAPGGLFRLESEGTGPVGQWHRLELPPEVSGLDFTEGRVHGLGPDVFVFTRTGEAARLTFDTCPE